MEERIYSSSQIGALFNLSVPELYQQLRNHKIISGRYNQPADEYLKAGYFVDRRKTLCAHIKFEMTESGVVWLRDVIKITPGENHIKRECYHCKRKRIVTLFEHDGKIKRTCDECIEKLEAIIDGNSSVLTVPTLAKRCRVNPNVSYYGGP